MVKGSLLFLDQQYADLEDRETPVAETVIGLDPRPKRATKIPTIVSIVGFNRSRVKKWLLFLDHAS